MTNSEKKQRSVLVTGSGSGIGAATARWLSKEGYFVILVGRTLSKLETVAKSLPGKSKVVQADLSQPPQIDGLVGHLKSLGTFYGLVNNAGIFERGNFVETSLSTWKTMFETNLLGPIYLAKSLVPLMEKNSAIINISSSAALRPIPGMAAYSTIKAGLNYASQALALELAPQKIRVHCVCPGIVATPIHGSASQEGWAEMHPLGRAGESDDVARVVSFLLNNESSWMTGNIIPVDGGLSLT